MKILIVGSGGREHAIAWKVAQSPKVDKIYCAPGNAGIAEYAECADIAAMEFDKLVAFAKEKEIDLTVIGMDDPLVGGVVDAFEAEGLRVFGPRKNAAILEGSKAFSKDLMKKYNIPTAAYETFSDPEAAEKYLHTENCSKDVRNGEIIMPGGHLTVAQLTAMLNTIPMEITFVDEDNINRFFNEGPKDFKRPGMAIDREVFSCHPPKVEQQVRHIIREFRKGTLDKVPIWMEKNGKTMLVTYMAVRDATGTYLGTMELVQDMGFAKEHFLSDVKAKEAALRAGMED